MLEIFISVVLLLVTYQIYAFMYFASKKFLQTKNGISQHTKNCNELNDHIEHLKSTYSYVTSVDYGQSHLSDESRYKMKRTKWQEVERNSWVHNCSATVCKNASDQPFKYLCKYFDIKTSEETLSKFEEVTNNFSAAEQGKFLLQNERNEIVSSIDKEVPFAISYYSRNRLINELGFSKIDLSTLYFPVYTFQYVSAGGNSSARCDIKLDLENLDKFIVYLSTLVKFRNSVAGQRALMTPNLREKIKNRDNFTCKICNLSTTDEKNLLLEIA